ncbi:MAG: proline/glycine betaine ABC transporter permease [Peptococcaceae bacterium]|nr:proline/glycine betaine ABC transporter permease [Peptococcaceae bacterium]
MPKIPIGDWVEAFVEFLDAYFGGFFEFVSDVIEAVIQAFTNALLFPPPVVLIAILMALVWLLANRKIALWTGVGLLLILNLDMWDPGMSTLALVLSSAFLALIVGIPIGILTAWSDIVDRIVRPILDFMQTMPPFVYLVPAVLLFDIGEVPALVATIIFAMPPVIRLTGLGIRQVPAELIEAAKAFGSTRNQMLVKVQLPLALPTIMAGVNQCIMLALSMVVIAAMIGAGGLGGEVLRGLQRLDVPRGFESGLAIVIVAIILDRITQNLKGKQKKETT